MPSFLIISHTHVVPLFHPQDKKVKDKIDARNQLETFCYNMKSNVEDKLKDKIESEDKEKVLEAVKEALDWMEENSDAGQCSVPLSDGRFSVNQGVDWCGRCRCMCG